jgi:hypothetical protein
MRGELLLCGCDFRAAKTSWQALDVCTFLHANDSVASTLRWATEVLADGHQQRSRRHPIATLSAEFLQRESLHLGEQFYTRAEL